MSDAGPERDPVRRLLITVSIMLATVMQVLDTTIANVALPHMQGSMSATQDQIAWVLTSYIVAAAIMTPPTGYLAGRFGRRRFFLAAVAGFTVASMFCGAANSLTEIVVFRLLQGMCGAALVPLSQAILLDTYPREKHGQAMALWGIGIMVGPILGPTLGGYLTEYQSWRWVFYINLPVGALAMLGILAFVPKAPRDLDRPFDWFGFTLLSLAIGALQMMLDRGQSQDWFASLEITLEAAVSGLCLYMFVAHMLTARRPFLEPALFRDRNFVTGFFLIFVVGVILLATLALLPPFLERLMGYPVLSTGYILAPRGFGTMAAMMIVGRLVGKVDARYLLLFGLATISLSLYEMSGFSFGVSTWTLIRNGILQGFGLGFIFVPLTTVAFASLAPRLRTEAAAMFSLMRNVGASVGVSVVVTVLARGVQVNHADLAARASPFNEALSAPAVTPYWDLGTAAGLAALDAEVGRQAAMIAYLNDFTFMMWVTLAAIPLVLLLRAPARTAPGPVAAAE